MMEAVPFPYGVPADQQRLVEATAEQLRAGACLGDLAHDLFSVHPGRLMDVYKILRAAGADYMPAKEAVFGAMSSEQQALHEQLGDAAEDVSKQG